MKVRAELEHPAQGVVSSFLRAIADDDAAGAWQLLSRESRGLLRGLHAARTGAALHEDGTIAPALAPLRDAIMRVLGGPARMGSFGVSGTRVVDRSTAYVLLLPDAKEGFAVESEWDPAHLVALVHESREWLVDLARTSALSAEAGLPDPLGPIR